MEYTTQQIAEMRKELSAHCSSTEIIQLNNIKSQILLRISEWIDEKREDCEDYSIKNIKLCHNSWSFDLERHDPYDDLLHSPSFIE